MTLIFSHKCKVEEFFLHVRHFNHHLHAVAYAEGFSRSSAYKAKLLFFKGEVIIMKR